MNLAYQDFASKLTLLRTHRVADRLHGRTAAGTYAQEPLAGSVPCEYGHVLINENAGWFLGGEGRTDDEHEFLSHLRLDAAMWGNDVRPADTSTFAWEFGPLVVGVDVPKLTTTFRHLWVSYWAAEPAQRALQGAWGDDLIADSHTGDRVEELTVAGVEAEPTQFATWCSKWLNNQVKRPVVREEWGSAGGAAVWKLADTNMKLQIRGPFWKRSGPPTRVHHER